MIVPDSIEPVTGWKGLRVHGDSIVSPNGTRIDDSFGWPEQTRYIAHCCIAHEDEGGVPEKGCTCGIYVAERYQTALGYTGAGGALVEVYGWGKVQEHEIGWRVQYAYPKRIVLLNGVESGIRFDPQLGSFQEDRVFFTKEFAEKLSKKYAVPVAIVDYEDYERSNLPVVTSLRFALSALMIGQVLISLATKNMIPVIINLICGLLLVFLTFVPLESKPPHERS